MKMKRARFSPHLALLVHAFFYPIAHAYEGLRPMEPRHLEPSLDPRVTGLSRLASEFVSTETVQAVPGTEVAWADYGRVLRDFPQLAEDLELEVRRNPDFATTFPLNFSFTPSDQTKLDRWLVDRCAFIGSEQSRFNGFRNTPIPQDPSRTKTAHRPSGWNRAAVLEVTDSRGRGLGMIDVKGFGFGSRSQADVTNQVYLFKGLPNQEWLDRLRIKDHSDGLMSLGEAGAEATRQRAVQTILERRQVPFETVETYAILRLPFGIYKEGNRTIPAALYLRQAHLGRHHGLEIVPDSVYLDPPGGKQYTDSYSIVDFGGVLLPDPAMKSHFGYDEDRLDPQLSKPWAWAHEAAASSDPKAVRIHIEQMDAAVRTALDTQGLPGGTVLAEKRFKVAQETLRKSSLLNTEYFWTWLLAKENTKPLVDHLRRLFTEYQPGVVFAINRKFHLLEKFLEKSAPEGPTERKVMIDFLQEQVESKSLRRSWSGEEFIWASLSAWARLDLPGFQAYVMERARNAETYRESFDLQLLSKLFEELFSHGSQNVFSGYLASADLAAQRFEDLKGAQTPSKGSELVPSAILRGFGFLAMERAGSRQEWIQAVRVIDKLGQLDPSELSSYVLSALYKMAGMLMETDEVRAWDRSEASQMLGNLNAFTSKIDLKSREVLQDPDHFVAKLMEQLRARVGEAQ